MSLPIRACLYGAPSPDLAPAPPGAVQVSPLAPGSQALEAVEPASLDAVTAAAPPGTLERRSMLALALRALKPGAPFTVLAPKARGGARLAGELQAFGCQVESVSRRHQRICHTTAPEAPVGLDAAIAQGALRRVEALGRWSQPGVFSWDRIDPGTALLRSVLPALAGRGADLGCGIGLLAETVLESSGVERLALVDIDRRAVEAAERNIADPRANLHWADARLAPALTDLDFVVANPPFHDGGEEDRALGQAFLRRSRQLLRKGGVLWVVANRHLPYEAVLRELFTRATPRAEAGGFKVYEVQA